MNKEHKRLLMDEIIDIKEQNLEEFWLYTKECICTYFMALISYGPFHQITKSVYSTWLEFYSILEKEENIMKFLKDNYNKIELSEVYLFLDELDEINKETYLYYIDILEGIKDASELKQPYRATRPKKEFVTLIETNDYEIKSYGLVLDFNDIKRFFNYSDEFWNYIEPRIRIINTLDEKPMNSEVIMKFTNNNCLEDIRVIVPEIVDLATSLINVHEFKYAYDLYQKLGSSIGEELEYEKRAQEEEDKFQKNYVLRLVK